MIAGMNILAIIIAVALAAVMVVLVVGIIAMTRGGEFNAKYGNRMMQMRVGLQALAVVLILLFVLVASQQG